MDTNKQVYTHANKLGLWWGAGGAGQWERMFLPMKEMQETPV